MKDIVIVGAKENNLKDINLVLPRNKLIVFTGVSGSGKSTLAFDTIFAEGQRRFIESLSSYARQFLGQVQKPNVEKIEGLSPAISIDQKTTSQNPRSTVGTVTEIYDYLRLLYARLGVPYCPHCNKPITNQSIDTIVDRILQNELGSKIIINAPVVRGQKGTFVKYFEELRKNGYARVSVDGEIKSLDEEINLEKNIKHDISVVIDRIILKENISTRLTEAVENAIKLSDGLVIANINGENFNYNTKLSCPECGFSFDEISPRLFSFNTPFGACPNCLGLGFTNEVDEDLVLRNQHKSINEGALRLTGWSSDIGSIGDMYYKALAKKYNFSLDVPLEQLPKNVINVLLYGDDEVLDLKYKSSKFSAEYRGKYEGIIPNLKRRYVETNSDYVKGEISKVMKEVECPVCKGRRLNEQALSVKIDKYNIVELCDLSIKKLKEFFENFKYPQYQENIAKPILKEIFARLKFLTDVGLEYLTLNRTAGTLSGGESQRIRLATQIGSGLVGVLYILDEPSIGLHQRDNCKLIETLKNLKDLGNTLIVVEHDEDTMRAADFIVDIGPKAGKLGGEVVVAGTLDDVKKCDRSITGQFLSGVRQITIPQKRRPTDKGYISIKGASQNNLKNVDVDIPLGVFNVVSGVSGSGKSSLINDILYPILANNLNRAQIKEGQYKSFSGLEKLDKVICIDQSPIGRTPRSNPATYTGVFTPIRELFASTNDAKERGYNSGRFSFNIPGGRCENCNGDGEKKIEMYFLPDVYVPCNVCKGKRYNRETLQVKYKGKNISDVLNMTVEEALKFFENIPTIKNKIQCLYDVGLGYIKLGQSATTLSGGEAQRVKLATELSKRSTGKTVYILDEPTTGLHSYDIDKLLHILNKLVDMGNTVIVIEHNLDVIKQADYIIDLGPEGGDCGGTIIAKGTPEQVSQEKTSYTGQFLLPLLKRVENIKK